MIILRGEVKIPTPTHIKTSRQDITQNNIILTTKCSYFAYFKFLISYRFNYDKFECTYYKNKRTSNYNT